jgi:hypothetical protein
MNYHVSPFSVSNRYGGLKLASVAMFRTFRVVENVVIEHFKSASHIYVRDSYQECISKISLCNVMPVSCEDHLDTLPFLIMEYLQIRFHFESKRLRNIELSKSRINVHAYSKLAKVS